MQHTISIYAFPIERTHTTNFQKGKIPQKRPLFDLRFEKATKIEIEFIDSDDKDVSKSDYAPLRQTHIRVSPLHTVSPAYHPVSSSSSRLRIAKEVSFHLRTIPKAMYVAEKEGKT